MRFYFYDGTLIVKMYNFIQNEFSAFVLLKNVDFASRAHMWFQYDDVSGLNHANYVYDNLQKMF